jgi:membrane-associated phospholipid phosphatase
VSGDAPPLLARVEVRLGLAFWAVAGTAAALCGAAAVFVPFAIPLLLLIAGWPHLRRASWAGAALDWLPFPLVVLTYEMLHAVVPRCWDRTIDTALREADRALIGTDVALLFADATTPALTVTMACFYSSYYLLPVSLAVWWWRRNRTAFRELMMGEVGALFIGYLGYLFLPAIGPHAHLPVEHFGGPLEGDFIGNAIRSLNDAHSGSFPRDAFPSLHTANGVTAILVCLRHERRLLWIYAPVVTGLVVATMYLRFHYAVDVVAGVVLAILWQVAVVRLVTRESENPPDHLQSPVTAEGRS